MKASIVLLFAFALFTAHDVRAAQEVTLEDNALVVKGEDGAIQMRVPNVPRGLSMHDAFKIATGRLGEMIIPQSKMHVSFNPPFFTWNEEHTDRIITYSKDEGWVTLAIMRSTEEKIGPILGFVLLWYPVLIIMPVSLAYVLNGWDYTTLAALYALAFVGTVTAAMLPETWFFGVLFVGAGGYVAGSTMIASDVQARGSAIFGLCMYGTLFGMVSGMVSNIVPLCLAVSQDSEGLLRYGALLLAIVVGSFILALLVKRVRERLRNAALA
jgi:hypothetical protein